MSVKERMERSERGVTNMLVSIGGSPQVGAPRVEPDDDPVSNDNNDEPRGPPATTDDQ